MSVEIAIDGQITQRRASGLSSSFSPNPTSPRDSFNGRPSPLGSPSAAFEPAKEVHQITRRGSASSSLSLTDSGPSTPQSAVRGGSPRDKFFDRTARSASQEHLDDLESDADSSTSMDETDLVLDQNVFRQRCFMASFFVFSIDGVFLVVFGRGSVHGMIVALSLFCLSLLFCAGGMAQSPSNLVLIKADNMLSLGRHAKDAETSPFIEPSAPTKEWAERILAETIDDRV